MHNTKSLYSNRDIYMDNQLINAIKYWDSVSTIFAPPKNAKDYDRLVNVLDELLDIIGDDQNHRLHGLAEIFSNLISEYDKKHYVITTKGVDALKFLMKEQKLRQSDLSEIASQGVISEILHGKRKLTTQQIVLLAKRFDVEPGTFLDDE